MKILLAIAVWCIVTVTVTARLGGRQEGRRNRCRYDRTVEWDTSACDVEGADPDVAMATRTSPLLSEAEECNDTRTETVKCSKIDQRIARQERMEERRLMRKNGCKYDFWTAEWNSTACQEDGADLSKAKGTVTMELMSQGLQNCPPFKVKAVSCSRFERWSYWKKQLMELKMKINEMKQEKIDLKQNMITDQIQDAATPP